MRHQLSLKIGPASFRIGSAWRQAVERLAARYDGYPLVDGEGADFTVRLEPTSLLRRWVRPSIFITGDHGLADAAPMSLAHGLLAAEMGMNLQMALGWRRHLLLHASSVEKDGRALVMTGESGSGKSTLAAQLGERGWRLMGDEFALLDLVSGAVFPFPPLISLKNGGITVGWGRCLGEGRRETYAISCRAQMPWRKWGKGRCLRCCCFPVLVMRRTCGRSGKAKSSCG